MAELKIFYRDKDKQDRIKVGRSVNILNSLDKSDIIWIDLLDVSDRTEGVLEDFLKIDIQEDEEMEEIEMSSRYIQTDDSIVANSNFLRDNFEVEPVNFILKNSILVTTRDVELASFNETVKKMLVNTRNFPTGYHVLVSLMETRVEKDADMICVSYSPLSYMVRMYEKESSSDAAKALVQALYGYYQAAVNYHAK